MNKLFRNRENFTDLEVSKMIALLYPAKAIVDSLRTDRVGQPSCPKVYENLGDEGIKIFKELFDNNNKGLRDSFFNDEFV